MSGQRPVGGTSGPGTPGRATPAPGASDNGAPATAQQPGGGLAGDGLAGDDAQTVGPQRVPSSTIRAGSRSANRAAKRAASGRPPAGTPGRPPKRSNNTTLAVVGLASVAVLVGAAVIAFGNPFGAATPSGSPRASGNASAATYGDGTCPTSQPASLDTAEKKTVTIETDLGNIVIEVDGARAPIATGNFIALVECEYYDDVVFHRLVPNFVIQGGDPSGTGAGPGPGYKIKDDPLVGTYKRGTVAMARSEGPDTQGSQFFIVLSDSANAALTDPQNAPYPYAILGEVTAGMDVVDAIAAMPNSGSGSGNAAVNPVTMNSVYVGAPSGSTAPSPAASPAASPASSASPASPAAAPTQ